LFSAANRDPLLRGKKVWAGGGGACIEIGCEMCSKLMERRLNRANCQMEFCSMKALSLGVLLSVITLSSAHAQRSPETLPPLTVDCYQSFAAKAPLPELSSKEIVIDGGNLDTPLIRYRLQVADKRTLKIIKDPDRPAYRTEHGKSVWEIKRDFTSTHRVVGWREELPGRTVRLFTFDFEDLLLSTIDVSPARAIAAGVELHVMRCSKSI
jgi:hypothetical protein